ncbi:MAG: hypothetical protein WD114_01195, partial [Phycisphaerales bacterium]
MRTGSSAAIVVCCAGLASAAPVHWTQLDRLEGGFDGHRALLTIDVSGMASWDFQGDPDNEIVMLQIGGAIPLRIEWDLYITTIGTSWASEVTIGIEDYALAISPGVGDDFQVTNMNYQGFIDAGNPSLDGVLEFEFYETGFDDLPGAPDAYFEQGSTITVIFPAPGALMPDGSGGVRELGNESATASYRTQTPEFLSGACFCPNSG